MKAVYFLDTYANNIRANATFDATEAITDAGFDGWSSYGVTTASTQTVFKYDLRPETAELVVNEQTDPATGVTFYEQVLTIDLQKLTKEDSLEMRKLSKNRAQIFVLDNTDNLVLLGMDHGMNSTGSVSTSGKAFSDRQGTTLNLMGKEKEDYVWIDATAGVGDGSGTPTTKYPFDGLADVADVTIVAGS